MRFRTAKRRRGSVCAPPPPPPGWGARRRFSRPADGGGNQGNPTHGACTGRAIGKGRRGRGVLQPTAPGSGTPPALRTLSCVRQRAAAGSSSVHSLDRGRECTDHTRGGVPSPPLSSPSRPLLTLPVFFSLALPLPPRPTDSMCLFVYSRVLGNTRYASNGASYTRRAALCRARPPAFPFWSCIRSVLGFLRDFEKRPVGGTYGQRGHRFGESVGTGASRPFFQATCARVVLSTFPAATERSFEQSFGNAGRWSSGCIFAMTFPVAP